MHQSSVSGFQGSFKCKIRSWRPLGPRFHACHPVRSLLCATTADGLRDNEGARYAEYLFV